MDCDRGGPQTAEYDYVEEILSERTLKDGQVEDMGWTAEQQKEHGFFASRLERMELGFADDVEMKYDDWEFGDYMDHCV